MTRFKAVKISKQVNAHLNALLAAWQHKYDETDDERAWAGVIGMDKEKVIRVAEEITRPRDNRAGCGAMVRLTKKEIAKAITKVVKRGFTPCGYYRVCYYHRSTGNALPQYSLESGFLLNKGLDGMSVCRWRKNRGYTFHRVTVVK